MAKNKKPVTNGKVNEKKDNLAKEKTKKPLEKNIDKKDENLNVNHDSKTKLKFKGFKRASASLVEETKKQYFGYSTRVIIFAVLFILLFVVGSYLIVSSFKLEDEKVIKYSESSNIDYKVYLKENEFYESPYLGKNMKYIASLIDHISVDFNYNYSVDELINMDFNYSIIGKLVILDPTGKSYYEKEYTLLDNKKINMLSGNYQNIKENIKIDYAYYNKIANSFKNLYGVDTDSKLIVYLQVNKNNNNYNDGYSSNSNSVTNVSIPLSEKAINITLDESNINEQSRLISDSNLVVYNIPEIIFGIILVLLAIVTIIKFIRLLAINIVKKTVYDKYVDRILKEYDRLIVETTSMPSLEDKELIKIDKFTELLDVRDNLKLPIMHFIVTKHQKSYFYILHKNTVYLNTVKSVDLEVSSNEKSR